MRKSLLLSVAAAGLLAGATAAMAAGVWVPVVPVANSTQTSAFGINDHNIITGDYTDSSGITHGFYGPVDGSNYVSFDDSGGATQPRAISDRNYITGYDTGTLNPWERFPNGTITNITKQGQPITEIAQEINIHGLFAGNYFNAKGVSRGYIGRNARVKHKFHLAMPPNKGYAGRALNDAGNVIGGWFIDPSTGLQHGFVLLDGRFREIDFPGTRTMYTVVEGINNHRILSGQWEDTSSVIHGFVVDLNGGSKHSYLSLDAPSATLTQVWGINDDGEIAVSSSAGSFIYCRHAGVTCPTAPGHPVQKPVNWKPAQP